MRGLLHDPFTLKYMIYILRTCFNKKGKKKDVINFGTSTCIIVLGTHERSLIKTTSSKGCYASSCALYVAIVFDFSIVTVGPAIDETTLSMVPKQVENYPLRSLLIVLFSKLKYS